MLFAPDSPRPIGTIPQLPLSATAFVQDVAVLAARLGDFNIPLEKQSGHGHTTIEHEFSKAWQTAKNNSPSPEAQTKQLLRSLGLSSDFEEILYRVIDSKLSCSASKKKELLTRFAIALRLAVHLSPDKGEAIYLRLGEKIQADRTPPTSQALTIQNVFQRWREKLQMRRAELDARGA